MELIFHENGLTIKALSTYDDVEAGFRLRHEVFSRELKWVPVSPDGMERDAYDGFSQHIGVFDHHQEIMGYARLITAPLPFMVDREFACLMPTGRTASKAPDVAEITRLCIKKEARSPETYTNISRHLYKGIYHWSLNNSIRHMIMVVDYRYFRLLRLNGFPVEALGDFKTMPDGVRAGAIMLDWREFEEYAGQKRPEFLDWMSKLPVPYPTQMPHELYLHR